MIIKYMPSAMVVKLRKWRNRILWKGNYRIFCISMQRNGTTSLGNFFSHFGYYVATGGTSSRFNWSKLWCDGDFETIFNSDEFNTFQVFEDDPWWFPEAYKLLYHRFPKSKFILFTRESDEWFKSMVSHSGGKTLGNTKVHCKIYRREEEFYQNVDNNPEFEWTHNQVDNLMSLEGKAEHYETIYNIRNREIIEFFNDRDANRLIICELKDRQKWNKLGCFFGINVPENFEMHTGKSKKG